MNYTSATRPFFDTNILVYQVDTNDRRKSEIARLLVEQYENSCVVSTQVLLELYRVLTGKLKISDISARSLVRNTAQLHTVETSIDLTLQAVDLAVLNQISIWDAAIISAAISARCDVLFTEDLNDGQIVEGVRLVNPFK